EQVRFLGDRAPTRAVNLPGFGGMPPAGDVMTMAAAADRCVEELDEAGFDHAVVCGLSMGGYVTFELWRRYRGRILGLVLADTRAEPDTEEGRKRRREVAELALSEGSAAIARAMETTLYGSAPDDLKRALDAIVEAQAPEAIAAASLG